MFEKQSDQLPTKTSIGDCYSLERGSIIVNDFCFGVRLDGKYTSAEIYNLVVKHKPQTIASNHPAVSDWSLYNKYVWVPWTRLAHTCGEHVIRRCQMSTVPSGSDDVIENYIGTGLHYDNAWTQYITTSDRLSAITKFTSIKNTRILDLGCGGGNALAMLGSYGADVYGIESHPEMYNSRNMLLESRVFFGDALECLYMFKQKSFDVVIVSMLGNVWWKDVSTFLTYVRDLVHPGGLVMLDMMPHKHVDLNARSMYKSIMQEIGIPMKLKINDHIAVGVRART